jgi:catechol 2,3-dioxygenase-like lactoylglutathione lyase family enzyme
MPIGGFQHINIRSRDVERARDFYERIIGLRVGDRPPFPSRGYWLYFGDQPIVHLTQRADDQPAHAGSGSLDHVAFRGVDFEATRAALSAAGIQFREEIVPRDQTRQIFVLDPDGIKLELNFEEDPPLV